MRPLGFSTGALAEGDFRAALRMLAPFATEAVELSALRGAELPALHDAADRLALDGFAHVSVHAPSAFSADEESAVVRRVQAFVERGWPVVLHPDTIHDPARWRSFGRMLLIENMDKRKPVGRTAEELRAVFAALPEARLCFDIAHAHQVDRSMTVAREILRAFGDRLAQVHVSEVNTASRHARISRPAQWAFARVAPMIAAEVPVIVESPVPPGEIAAELEAARDALPLPAPLRATA